jgi:DinB superfamily
MSEVTQLLAILDQAYNRPSWHGTNLRGSIRRVSAQRAAWRPGAKRHNIWENVVHAAYWKYAASLRFVDQPRGSFRYKGSNWFRRPDDATEVEWRRDVALLDQTHALLRSAVARLSTRQLHQTPRGKKVSNFVLLSGIAAHDLYHAGQIQLIKRLAT